MGYFEEMAKFAKSKAGKNYMIKAKIKQDLLYNAAGNLKPKKAKRNNPEKKIEDEILRYLRLAGWMSIKFNSGVILNPVTGAPYRSYFIANTKKTAGISDIFASKNGRAIFFEVKTEKGRQSQSQKEFQALCGETGTEYYVVRSVAETEKIILGK